MKLMIDIPEELKNRLCFGVTYSRDIQVLCEALNDGTPLDDIKAEILDCMTDGIKYYDQGRDDGLKLATLIIDKHTGKEK